MSNTAIVIGAGHAGAELSLQLREQGWPGRIVLIGEEPHLPYHRPPLSKSLMSGAVNQGQIMLRPLAAYQKADVELRLGERVRGFDVAAHTLTLEDGGMLEWDGLAVATGARARRLILPGMPHDRAPPNLLVLRTLDDALAIRARCTPGARIVIVGGGYIGLELAASAAGLGALVTLLEALPRVLARVAGPEIAECVVDTHRAAGVDLRVGVQLTGAVMAAGRDDLAAVELAGGERIGLDLLVAGIGIEPEVGLAQAAGLQIDNGVTVDEWARTSAAGVVAAGDCTCHPSALYGRRIRLESVPNALEQARTAAATLAGRDRPYRQAPWFWSDQFDLKMKSVGLLAGHDRTIVRGDRTSRSFSVFYLQGDRVLAVDTVNATPDFLAAKRIVGEDLRVPVDLLADPTRPLKDHLPPPSSGA